MALKIDDNRFRWGLNFDDMWGFAGLPRPKNIVIPHLLSVKSRSGSFTVPRLNAQGAEQRPGRWRRMRESRIPVENLNESVAFFLKASRIDFVRCWLPWNFFEKYVIHRDAKPGEDVSQNYVFPLDDFVSKITEKGIGVIAVIGNGYSRFLPPSVTTDDLHVYLQRLIESSTQIVRHYKDKIKTWQIENEPNWWKAHALSQWRTGAIWRDSKNQEPILQALNNVVRSECPDCKIVINLEADSSNGMEWSLYAKYCDVLGLDFYPNYAHSFPSDASVISKTAFKAKQETGLPTYVIETGYPTGPRLLGYNEEKQSKYVRAACEQAYSCDAISGLGWFRFADSYWKSFPAHENHFGLLSKAGRPKMGWFEFQSQIEKSGRPVMNPESGNVSIKSNLRQP